VHRDISPQNLFLTLEGTVKVLDFGIAKAEHRKTRTEHGQLKGKLRYMSPEQLGSRAIDRRSDVYSLGIVLAEVLSGELFFRERNPEAALEERERPKDLPPMEPGLDRIVAKATASSVRERYGSAEDFALDLERYLVEKGCLGLERALANEVRLLAPESVSANQEIRAFSRTVVCPSPVHDATPGTSAGSTMQPGAPSTPGRRRRRRIVVGAALLLGSAMLGGALVTALHGDESDTPVRVVQLGGEPRPTEADLASGSRPIGTPPVVAPVTPVDSSEPEPPPPPADEMHGVRAPTTQEEGGSSETDDTPSTNEGRSPARMIRRSAMGASRMRRPREPRIDWAHGMFK
ncbi:MAG: protein kinase, partial [Myxococcota bacterium]